MGLRLNLPDNIPADLSDVRFDARYCRTHAFTARLYAAYPRRPSHTDMWSNIAQLWADLAAIKERMDAPDMRQPDPRRRWQPSQPRGKLKSERI